MRPNKQTESLVASILQKDHAESIKGFQALIATKVAEGLEAQKFSVASSLIGEKKATKHEEEDLDENASFNYAAASAAVAGESEFEFQGETYPVEMDIETAREIVAEAKKKKGHVHEKTMEFEIDGQTFDAEIKKDGDMYDAIVDGDVVATTETRKEAKKAIDDFVKALRADLAESAAYNRIIAEFLPENRRRYAGGEKDADKHIIAQLLKAQDLLRINPEKRSNQELRFRRGKVGHFTLDEVNKVLKAYNNIRGQRNKRMFALALTQSPEAFAEIANSLTGRGLPREIDYGIDESYSVFKPMSPEPGRSLSNKVRVKKFRNQDSMYKFLATGSNSLVWEPTETEGLKSGVYTLRMKRGADGKPEREFIKN